MWNCFRVKLYPTQKYFEIINEQLSDSFVVRFTWSVMPEVVDFVAIILLLIPKKIGILPPSAQISFQKSIIESTRKLSFQLHGDDPHLLPARTSFSTRKKYCRFPVVSCKNTLRAPLFGDNMKQLEVKRPKKVRVTCISSLLHVMIPQFHP